jgi:hypothetical protein
MNDHQILAFTISCVFAGSDNEYLTLGRTIIGASAWTLHAKGEMFGQRAEEFRPERWLEADDVERERTDNALFTFGYESRGYIGMSIRLLEIYKAVPAILLKFEVNLRLLLLSGEERCAN